MTKQPEDDENSTLFEAALKQRIKRCLRHCTICEATWRIYGMNTQLVYMYGFGYHLDRDAIGT